MGADNLILLEVLEWFDETGQELLHRLPERGSGEIKFGAQQWKKRRKLAVKLGHSDGILVRKAQDI